MWTFLRSELREIVWLASIVGGLSIMGVMLAVILSQTVARLCPTFDSRRHSGSVDRQVSAGLRATFRPG
jgi:hypothetical protein